MQPALAAPGNILSLGWALLPSKQSTRPRSWVSSNRDSNGKGNGDSNGDSDWDAAGGASSMGDSGWGPAGDGLILASTVVAA